MVNFKIKYEKEGKTIYNLDLDEVDAKRLYDVLGEYFSK